jgi:hypothetical protein
VDAGGTHPGWTSPPGVFTIPRMLRVFFKYKRSLLSGLCLCGKEALLKYFKAVAGRELTPGIIAVIQSFGSKINHHPHLHFLLTEGGEDKEGRFHKVSNFNDSLLTEFFSREVFSLLLSKQLINLSLVQKVLRWRHSGFNAHRGKMRKRGVDPSHPPIIEDETPLRSSLTSSSLFMPNGPLPLRSSRRSC